MGLVFLGNTAAAVLYLQNQGVAFGGVFATSLVSPLLFVEWSKVCSERDGAPCRSIVEGVAAQIVKHSNYQAFVQGYAQVGGQVYVSGNGTTKNLAVLCKA